MSGITQIAVDLSGQYPSNEETYSRLVGLSMRVQDVSLPNRKCHNVHRFKC